MITHTEIKKYNNADDYLSEKLKTVPAGDTRRGDGYETVRASMYSITRFLKQNRNIIQTYYSYLDSES